MLPEWNSVPSPRFWKRCGAVGERRPPDPLGALAAHLRHRHGAATDQRGHRVAPDAAAGDRALRARASNGCAGSPLQKYGSAGRELAAGPRAGRGRPVLEERDALARPRHRRAGERVAEPGREDRRDAVGGELAVGGHEACARLLVVLADDPRADRRGRRARRAAAARRTNASPRRRRSLRGPARTCARSSGSSGHVTPRRSRRTPRRRRARRRDRRRRARAAPARRRGTSCPRRRSRRAAGRRRSRSPR